MEPQYDPLFQNTPKGKKIFKALKNTWFVMGLLVTVLILVGFGYFIWAIYIDDGMPEDDLGSTPIETAASAPEKGCNVIGTTLHGELYTYISPADLDEKGNVISDSSASEWIISSIDAAEENKNIKAIILEIDSYGGQPVAGEEIANTLKLAKKPTVAFIRQAGVSAAYWAATGADTIFASKNSDIGSIGVTMSYIDHSNKNTKDGLTFNQLSVGKFKDSGNSDKPLTLEEKKLYERDLNIIWNNFILAVANNRKLSIAKVKSLADGSSMLGEQALKNGLIDKIGDFYAIKDFLKEKLGEEANICWE